MTKIAVVGVMESVGREILSFLEEDGVKAEDVFALEPRCPLGNQVSYAVDIGGIRLCYCRKYLSVTFLLFSLNCFLFAFLTPKVS